MLSAEALLDLHDRSHRTLTGLLAHCREFTDEELNRTWPGFGYGTLQLQLHHVIGAERYWTGVLEGRIDADDDEADFPTVESLGAFHARIFSLTQTYLRAASPEELNSARPMMTWGGRERELVPALVIMRVLTHVHHHAGQMTAMCRLLGRPCAGLDFPHS